MGVIWFVVRLGDSVIGLFDIAVYLWVPHELRMSRLKTREIERYGGEVVCPNGVWRKQTQEFLDWAAEYDTGGLEIRSRALHESWMESLPCPILQIRRDISISEKVERVITKIRALWESLWVTTKIVYHRAL
jgi:hypothetical protein